MSDVTQEILFFKAGLDTDSANTYMENGDAPYRLNILVGEDGSNGVITNMQGNKLATYPLTLSHTYQVNGSHYNQLTRKVYYLVFSAPYDWSGSGDYIYDNHLLEFNEDTEAIVNIWTDEKNYFGLDLHYPVKDCDMLGDKLYFNTRVSEPKMIDITRALNYTTYDPWQSIAYLYGDKVRFFGGVFVANEVAGITAGHSPTSHPTEWTRVGDSYQNETLYNFDSEFRYAFNVINQIPVYRPNCAYGSDIDKNANNVRGKVFRFSYRYKYFDDSYSLFGAYSDVVLPLYDEYYDGEVPGDIDLYNYIGVNVSLHSAALIKEVDIIFQETGKDWRRAKIINRQDISLLNQANYTYKFYNTDSAYEVIDEKLLTEAFDSVPKKAATQELINKNILSYGGCTEGFDNLDKNDIDVSLTPEIEAITIPNSPEVAGRNRDNLVEGDWVMSYASGQWQFTLTPASWYNGGGWSAGDIYVIRINGMTSSFTLGAGDVDTLDHFCSAIWNFIHTNYPILTGGAGTTTVYLLTGSEEISFGISLFYQPSVTANVALTKVRGFKTGAWHPLCLFYYDGAMRRWDAQTSKENIDMGAYQIDGTTVYVPSFNEYSVTPATTANRWKINWEVNHLPPSGAKYWRWGYAGNALCSYFVQYIISDITDEDNWTKLNITPLQTIKTTTEVTWNQFPQSVIDPYVWQQGDRFRVITEVANGTDMGMVYEGVLDYEIVKYDETTVAGEYWIYTQDFDYGIPSPVVGAKSLIEIYRPLKTDTSRVFYEFGDIMPIVEDANGVMVHGCGVTGTQNQDTSTNDPATGVFEAGDVYHILRTPSLPINTVEGFFHESMWYSDFYDSDDYDKGRIGIETSFGERTLNIVRYSNQYLQNTGINGLPTFKAKNYKELSDTFGNIVGMVEVGTTLKVYMEKKSASILIGRQEYMDSDGKVTIATSDVVLGAIRYPENTFGTQWLESITKNNRYTYGFDIYNAVMWRDSANGIFPISGRYQEAGQTGDYKMQTWFRDKSDTLMLSGIENLKVLTVWDEKYKNLYVIFKDHANNANNETIVYHEPSDRWICFASLDQTPVEGFDEMLELDYWILKGFENGIGYSFDEDTRFAVFNIPVTRVSSTAYPEKLDIQFTLFEPTTIVDTTAIPDKVELGLELFEPTVVTSACLASDVYLAFSDTDDSYAEGQTTLITAGYNDPTLTARIMSKPVWITIWRGDNNTGYEIYEGDLILDQETITVFPNATNAQYYALSGEIVLEGDYGDTTSITVTQAVTSAIPSGQVLLPSGIALIYYDSVDDLSIVDNTYNIWGLSDDTVINYSIKGFINDLYGLGVIYDLYCRVDITRGGVPFTESIRRVIPEVPNSIDSNDYTFITGQLILSSVTVPNDIVTLYFSIYPNFS